ncbi:MAG: hypothetical protein PHE27_02595 [Alphaproteobacteria bacterium]|nr:hypothetical protein [Alphaproteobacteria bacterium]
MTSTRPLLAVLLIPLALSACHSLRRDDAAALAKTHMVGMTKEDVLGCMGPPRKKETEGTTEVWSYLSTDGNSRWIKNGYRAGTSYKPRSNASLSTAFSLAGGESEKRFCIVNVTMKNGIVKAVHYLGPAATYEYNTFDQCGYAVAACVDEAR